MAATAEAPRLSQTGLVARSPEGHAAKGMAIKGQEDLWVEIQANTFRNWVNEHLRSAGAAEVRDLAADLRDGTRLCALVEALQRRPLRPPWLRRPANHHQYLENVSSALAAIAADGVKLVNIGNVDIVNGNLKLVLGLIWSLIVRYQIGRSKFPPRKLMLAWLKAVLPECRVTNFTTDWNSGVFLSALLDYCRPGLMPHWRDLDHRDGVANCRRAMEVARRELGVPVVLQPEYLSSPHLDELSGMTYLSYFMREGGPGYAATLRWVQSQLPDMRVRNFTRDWNDGTVLCSLVRSLGGPVPGYEQLQADSSHWEPNLNKGLQGGRRLGVEPILRAKDMSDTHVEHLGVMAYAAHFQWLPQRRAPGERAALVTDGHTARVHKPFHFRLDLLSTDVDAREVRAEVVAPSGRVSECRVTLSGGGGKGSFVPTEVGMHQLTVYNEGEVIRNCPMNIRAVPELSSINFPGLEPCAVGSIVEVLINSNGGSTREVDVRAHAPSGRTLPCPVRAHAGVHSAAFQPDEAGEWRIAVTHGGEHIQGGPFTCFVFDPNGVKLRGLENVNATAGQQVTFTMDTTATGGLGDVRLDVVSAGRSLPHRTEALGGGLHRVTFTPTHGGKHRIYMYFNGQDVKGSPYLLRVSGPRGTRDKSASPIGRHTATPSPSLLHHQESLWKERNSHTAGGVGDSSPGFTSPVRTRVSAEETPWRRRLAASTPLRTHTVEEISRTATSPPPFVKVTPPTPQITSNSSSKYFSDELRSSSTLEQRLSRTHLEDTQSPARSPAVSPLHFGRRTSPVQSPSSQLDGGRIDTSSNVRVSAMLGSSGARADSWDAIAKTRGLLSYGSLESLANLAARPEESSGVTRVESNSFSSVQHLNHVTNHSLDEADTTHPRFATASPQPGLTFIGSRSDGLKGARSSPLGIVNALVTGDSLKLVPVNRQASFDIELPDGSTDPSDVTITITAPSSRTVAVQVLARAASASAASRLSALFTAIEVGEHTVEVRVRGARVPGSPFRTHAFDARAIAVGRIPDGAVGRPVEFEIDGRGAGSGNLEILVNGGHVTSQVRSLGGQRFLASFVPHEALAHLVDMKFNGEPVHGSPWEVQVMSEAGTAAAEVAAAAPGSVGAGGGAGALVGGVGRLSLRGDAVRLVAANTSANFELSAPGARRQDIDVHVISPSRRPLAARVVEDQPGDFRVAFTPVEVGAHLVEVAVGGRKLPAGPLVAKVYNAALIRVTDVASGVVGQPCQFRVDASQAGEGQLEISINEGEVPNHVQVVGGGRCLVSFTPEASKPHLIDIKFNGETVTGCPFVCAVSDTNRVSLTLRNLELVPVNEVARFHMAVDGSGSAELAVSVHGPANAELPVKVTGNIHSGFTAEFTPRVVGAHSITVEYNGHPVSGTPFIAKAYDTSKVLVGPLPRGSVGKTLQFMVDASQAGEGNLEITISARGHNIPTQVHPQGNARFAVSFVPVEPCDHVIAINFNKESVPGSPFLVHVQGDSPHQVLVSGPSLSAAAVGKTSFFTVSNVAGSVEDIEVNVEGPGGQAVPAQVKETGTPHAFQVEFTPRTAGEHRIMLAFRQVPVAGSPFSCKVYDVSAIRVTGAAHGLVSKPVTFLVETREAGPGNLEVTVNGGRVPTSAQAQGPHTYAISFTPREAIPHTVDLRFNGEDVPGSPFECLVSEAARVIPGGEGLEKVSVGRQASFIIDADTTLGQPEVTVLGPARRSLPTEINPQTPGRYNASFTPLDVGDHSVEVKLGSSHIEGSPFLVKAYDASKVKVTDIYSGVVGKPVFFSINASQAGAGNLEIIVSVGGRNVPNYVQAEGNAKFRVNFKPQEAAPHSLSVRFNGEPVPGSPFTCRVLPGSQALVSGSALKMAPAGKVAQLFVDPQAPSGTTDAIDGGLPGSSGTLCTTTVTSPSGLTSSAQVTRTRDGKFCAEFTPTEVGRYSLAVNLDGELVKGSPFACNVYDVEKVKVTGLGTAKVGKPSTFTVDASEAGEGTLELVVSTERTTVKAEVVACARGLYDVTFVPHEVTPHFVNISFNEEDVPGSPFHCDVILVSGRRSHPREPRVVSVRGDGLRDVAVGITAIMDIDPRGLEGRLDAEVTGPMGTRVPCAVRRLPSGLWRAEYVPVSVGPHSVAILQDGQPISKTPYTVHVFDPRQARIIELEDAFCHRASTFRVDSSAAGRGVLTVSVRAAGQEVKNTIRDIGEGLHEIIFHPKLAVPHRVDVKLNGMHIAGCPMEVPVRNPAVGQDVMATGLGLYQSRAGRTTSFVIETLGLPTKDFDVLITGPQGAAVPVRCYQQKDGNLLAEFTASNAGIYKIEVSQGARAVRGSPYYCQVYDASKIKLADVGAQSVSVNDKIAFKLLRKDAGFAELDVTVTSPLGQDLPLEVKSSPDEADTDLIEFCPSVAGNYRFSITYGGEEVPGSPLTFTVEDLGIAKASGDGLVCGQVDCPATFKVIGTGLMGKPSIQVDGPDSTATCTLEEEGDGAYSVSYTPREVGVFDVQVCWDGSPVPGSPFHPKVVDPRKVRVIGGWEAFTDNEGRLELALHQTKKISFELGEAGPGQLTAECRGPAGDAVPVAVEVAGGSRARLLLTPRAAGEHLLYLQFGGFPLPRSPVLAIADGPEGGNSSSAQPVRVVLTGRGLAGAKAHEEAEFTIDGSQAGPGFPEVTLTGMKADIRVNLQHLGGNVYRATYTPVIPGAYLLNVMWSDRQVKGCPLKVAVTAVADASHVVCSGDGLRVGTVGKEIRSFIDTRRAGPGELTAHCVGPHKVAYCELYEHGDGTFTLNVKPQEAGRHALTIKYGGEHVTGSPFALRVAGAPDPSKVRVYGPGVEHGVLASFQSRFICDTRGAGAGQLTVRIRGPKGAFRVEMQRESQKDRTILCKYDPTEPGDYRVEVKWAGELVPGSPFVVMIFDTQEELSRFLQGSHSPGSELYGSVGYSTGYAHMNFGGAQPSWRGSQAQL